MRKTAIFFLILLLPFRIPLVNSAPDEGYGEANENLGQFTDTFINETYVSVLSEVIINTTLECVELNVTFSPPLFNISNFVETDPVNRYSQTYETSTWVGLRRGDATSRLVGDMGVDYFIDSFSLYFEVNITDADAGDATWRSYCVLLALMNHATDYDDNRHILFILNQKQTAPADDSVYEIFMHQKTTAGLSDSDTSIQMDVGINYFMNLTRHNSGDSVKFTIKTGSHTGAIHDTLDTSIGTFGGEFLRYVFVPAMKQNANDPNDWISGNASRFTEGWGSGFVSEGYFTTEDYLNYTQGKSLALLTIADIPVSTGITVQFSSDNVTWVDNHGAPGSSTIRANFSALDLRDLNYADIFMNYTLSGPGGEVTPRLNQSRIVTTNGTAGGAPGPGVTVIESDAPWIALAIILSIIAFLLATRIKR